jgi:hypothetical protein
MRISEHAGGLRVEGATVDLVQDETPSPVCAKASGKIKVAITLRVMEEASRGAC